MAERIMALFEESGATQVERLAALDVARALVPVCGGSLIEPSEQGPTASEEGRP